MTPVPLWTLPPCASLSAGGECKERQGGSSGSSLPQYMVKALRKTQHINPGLKMPANRPVTYVGADGQTVVLRKSEEHTRFLFRMSGCTGVCQHYKFCTPHALEDEHSLLCAFCAYYTPAWQAAGRAALPPDELDFMRLLATFGRTEMWCRQVRVDAWTGNFDFHNIELNVFVQVDGEYHFPGSSDAKVVQRDLRCNIQSFTHNLRLVRVHYDDLAKPEVVWNAMLLAHTYCGVVFTSAYKSKGAQHIDLLLSSLTGVSQHRYNAYDNYIFWHKIAPT